MSNFEKINATINPETLLTILGYEVKKQMPCPIPSHGGDNSGNFCVFPDTWKCFSHNCGGGNSRDTVNLYTYIQFDQPFKNLSTQNKKNTLDFFGGYVTLDNYSGDRNKLEIRLKGIELDLIAGFFRKKNTIADLSKVSVRSDLFNKFILFHAMWNGKDYKKHKQSFLDFCKVDYFYDELRNYMKGR